MEQHQGLIETEKVVLEIRKKLTMTGVETVDGFTEQRLTLTVGGKSVTVTGEGIKITAFNKTTGNLTAEGLFNEIKYNAKKAPLVKRIFK